MNLKKRSFENSIENNNRKAFYKNAKDNFKANLKSALSLGSVYLLTTLIIDFLKDGSIDFVYAILGTAFFSLLVLIGGSYRKR